MNLVVNKNKYYIPKSWNEVSLDRYIEFMSTHNKEASAAEQELHLLTTITGAPYEYVADMKRSDLSKALDRLTVLMQDETDETLVLTFEIGEVEYGFHPNLSDMKLKEFVDLDNKLSDVWPNMAFIMAILYRPIVKHTGDKYKIEEYDYVSANKRAAIFRDELSVALVNAAASFFLTIAADYMKIMQAYSKLNRKQKRKASRLMKSSFKRNTAGTA